MQAHLLTNKRSVTHKGLRNGKFYVFYSAPLMTTLGGSRIVMNQFIAWGIVLLAFVAPIGHVAFTRDMSGRSERSTCPFSPRIGWIVMVLFLGPLGWFLFIHARHRRPKAKGSSAS